jgi:hypothetical protein
MNEIDRRLGSIQYQRFQPDVQCAGYVTEQENRDISLSGLKLRQISFRNSRISRQNSPRHSAACPRRPHSVPEQLEKADIRRSVVSTSPRRDSGAFANLRVILHISAS